VRIVSLLPSATEIVCALGLRDRLVGVTHECDFPEDVATLPKVTRTLIPKDASSGAIDGCCRSSSIRPDLTALRIASRMSTTGAGRPSLP